MFIQHILTAGALVAVAAAVPLHQPIHHPLHLHHHKRDVVWTTKVVEEFVTVQVTTTVFGRPGETPGSNFQGGHDFGPRPQRTSHVFQTITVRPQPAPPAASQPAPASAPPAPAPSQPAPAAPAPAPSQPASAAPAPAPSQPAPAVPAPAPSQPAPVAPAPSQPAAPAPAPSQPAPAPQPPSGGGGGSGPFTGDITYYTPGLGSCGKTNTASDMIVALAEGMMEAALGPGGNPNDNPNCGRSITISHGGKTAQATIEDTCPGCSGASLDLTPTLFEVFDSLSVGRVSGVQWWFN